MVQPPLARNRPEPIAL